MHGDVRPSGTDRDAAAYGDPWLAARSQRGDWPAGMTGSSHGLGPPAAGPPGLARLRHRFLLALTVLTVGGCRPGGPADHPGPVPRRVAGCRVPRAAGRGRVGLAAAAGLVWMARRMWRRGAWLEALPLLAGQPWLSRVVWAGRLIWTGHSLWRLRARLRPATRP